MSTKIYNGFKFKNPDVHRIWKQMRELRKEIWNQTADLLGREYARTATLCFDYRTLGDPVKADDKPEMDPVRYAFKRVSDPALSAFNDERGKDQHPLASMYDYRAQVAIYPLSNRNTLGVYFIHDRELDTLFRNQPWFIDYHYQNQTDRPKSVTARQWSTRKNQWDKVFSVSDVYAQAGFVMDLHDKAIAWQFPPPEIVMPHVKTYAKRVRELTESAVFRQYEEKNPPDIDHLFTHQEEFKKYLESGAGQRAWKKHEKRIRSKLKKRIITKDLFGHSVNLFRKDEFLRVRALKKK